MEQYTEEQILELEKELTDKLRKLREARLSKKPQETVDVEYRRLDPVTREETTLIDDLSSIGFREFAADPKNPAKALALAKNLKERPDIVKKLKKKMTSEDFVEKAIVTVGGAIFGYYLRGEVDKWRK